MSPLIATRGGAAASAYGLTSVGKPTVTGGTLASDSTYYYRTFTANGTLTVTGGDLPCDILVVSGGGAGSNAQIIYSPFMNLLVGGGGGAGGLKLFTQTLPASAHTVTVGAGGSGAVGNSSSLGSYSTTGGGFFQTNGGSGQGKSYWNNGTANAGAGISGEGNAGADFFNGVVQGGKAGGGGGSGSAGSSGNGGDGTNAYSSWATATSTGVSGRYAAGGAGSNNPTGGGLGGGGGGSVNTTGGNGTANTGSGGGGTSVTVDPSSATGGNGGSGIVIVRYLKSAVA